jgi:NDP-sugar pyrophosphorylase family protein
MLVRQHRTVKRPRFDEIEIPYAASDTGGAIKKAIPLLGNEFVVMYGDSYLDFEFARVYDAFGRAAKPALMTVFHNRNQWDASNVEFGGGNSAPRKGQSYPRYAKHRLRPRPVPR